jgi:hypothetical protein
MISFDLECKKNHRFEGIFKDYGAFASQLEGNMIACPLCESTEVKRIFTGCSIQARTAAPAVAQAEKQPNIFELVRMMTHYIRENFEDVGKDFSEKARAIYYGEEEQRNIFGESTANEIKELRDEGIEVALVPHIDKLEN